MCCACRRGLQQVVPPGRGLHACRPPTHTLRAAFQLCDLSELEPLAAVSTHEGYGRGCAPPCALECVYPSASLLRRS